MKIYSSFTLGNTLFGLCVTFHFFLVTRLHAQPSYDIVIYGGTSAAVIAAVQASKKDKTVIIVSPDEHIGGMTTSGLGWTDAGKKHVIGGLSRSFYHRIWEKYQSPSRWKWQPKEEFNNQGQGGKAIDDESETMWTFEPHVAEEVYEDLLKEYNVTVQRNQWLDREQGVSMDGTKITAIQMLSGETYKGNIFIDATYEGDLMAAAGVSYIVGRESNDTYGETLNGIQTQHAVKHQFTMDIDPYVVPGDPSSGMVARIPNEHPGPDGTGDHRVQAYCYRLAMTKVPENRVPFERPQNYDSTHYELLLRVLNAGWREGLRKFDPIPNKKTDTNNHGPFSTDNIGMNYGYPEASYDKRRDILEEHKQYQLGLFYFLANDPRVPEDVQSELSQWGLSKDEFTDTDHWPRQIYIREARRMIGDLVVNERHLRRLIPTERSVGMGSYNMDSHNVMRYINEEGLVKNEGDVQINPGGPYPIDYGAIIPQKEECTNLLVPVAVSASHIAFGSIRMEPVFMVLGQSATTAAIIAMDNQIAVQDVPYEALKKQLLEDGQILEITP